MTRIRAFLVSQGRPRANVVVEINVELLTGNNPTPLPTMLLQSDHVGFVAISLPKEVKPEHVWLYPVAEPSEQYDVWPALEEP